jgi:hypothetical protein
MSPGISYSTWCCNVRKIWTVTLITLILLTLTGFGVFTINLVIIDQQSVGKRSLSDGHCQCGKEMDDRLLAWQQIFEREPHSDSPSKRASIIFEN